MAYGPSSKPVRLLTGRWHKRTPDAPKTATPRLCMRHGLGALAGALILMMAQPARAADTIETWEKGATDVELYGGYDGMGLAAGERIAYGDVLIGYGIAPRFSAFLGMTLEGSDAFSQGSSTHYFGAFGTPLDTNHFDLDLILEFSQGGFDQTFEIRPAVELNYDQQPDMSTWGLYVRAPLPIYGRRFTSPLHPDESRAETTYHLETSLGAYLSPATGHQILAEYTMGYHPSARDDERAFDLGGVALGYNFMLTEELEAITQLTLGIPQDDESWSVSAMVGFIATLPSPAQ